MFHLKRFLLGLFEYLIEKRPKISHFHEMIKKLLAINFLIYEFYFKCSMQMVHLK